MLLASPGDVWKLVGEPYHLPDWWPGYRGVKPDRKGLAEGARWVVQRGPTRSGTSNLLRRPGGDGTLVIRRVVPGSLFAWHDVELALDATVAVEPAAERRARATVSLEGSWWRITSEGMRSVPRVAVARLHDLCQTASSL